MSHGNGNGAAIRWAVGTVIVVVAGWLTLLSMSGATHATHREVSASEARVTNRLERIEDKVDRLLERGR